MLNFTELPPLSLYIHYPWCVQKCPYCDFNSHVAATLKSSSQADQVLSKQQRDQQYVQALLYDLQLELPGIWGRSVQSVFIGGGTPSLIQPESMQQLLSQIKALVNLSPLAEITMEANPGAIDQGKFAEFRSAGINRLSIGIQSFDDQLLHKIGRIHDGQQSRLAIERAQAAGFDNINLDLMYALPGQTLASALSDVKQASAFETSHLSHYQLTLEPNTLFANAPPILPDDDLSYDMQIQCQQVLAQAGFEQYEVSAYARSGQQCRHNLNYWQFGDYLGIGAGAHGKISNAAEQRILRRWKEKHPQRYMEKFAENSTTSDNCSMIEHQEQLTRHDIGFEFMLNTSRLVDGFSTDMFPKHTGMNISQIEEGLQKALEFELIERQAQHIKPTARGLRYLNELQELFL